MDVVDRPVPDVRGASLLGGVLRDAGYGETEALEALGVGRNEFLALKAAFAVAPLRSGTLATLAALFRASAVVGEEAAAEALPLDRFVETGLAVRVPGGVRATLRVDEYDGLLVACDAWDVHPARDFVLQVGPAARETACLVVRRPVDSALDLCAGSGILALLQRRAGAGRVVGTDLNGRALEFARFNAELNGLDGIDWRVGDLLEPVEGETFAAVAANPPYVISPGGGPIYRDAEDVGDSISRNVTAGAAEVLEPGGFATVSGNWIQRAGEEWYEQAERWLDEAECDLLVLQYTTDEILDYAAQWSDDVLERDGTGAYVAAVERHRDYLAHLGADAVVDGVVVMRKRRGRGWRRREVMSFPRRGSGSDQLLRIFEAEDFLAGLADERELLDVVLEPAPGARVVGSSRLGPGDGDAAGDPHVELDEQIGLDGHFPAAALPALQRLDGRLALRDALGDSAAETLPAFRQLLARGFLRRPASTIAA